jgi:hypothetical protein
VKRKVFVARYRGLCACGCGQQVEGKRVVKVGVMLADCRWPKLPGASSSSARPAEPVNGSRVAEVVDTVPAGAVPVRSLVGPVAKRNPSAPQFVDGPAARVYDDPACGHLGASGEALSRPDDPGIKGPAPEAELDPERPRFKFRTFGDGS